MSARQRELPKTRKIMANGRHNGLNYALGATKGWRRQMEDRHHVSLALPEPYQDWAYVSVFDGHTGRQTAAHCSRNLLPKVVEKLQAQNNLQNNDIFPENAIKLQNDRRVKCIIDAFLELDREMGERCTADNFSGSTASCAFISRTHFYFANCGDSRALLCRNGKLQFATVDHKPTRRSEKRRIVAAGGEVRRRRVNGRLAMSRAMGDFEYKDNEDKGQCEQMVIAKPDVTVIERMNDVDEFIVVASDGIWDVMTNSELISFIKNQMIKTADPQKICNAILDRCFQKGSRDNLSVILTILPGCPSLQESQRKRKADLTEMSKAIQAKKARRAEPAQRNAFFMDLNANGRNAMAAPNMINQRRGGVTVPGPFIQFYLDYFKTAKRKGNLCERAKSCGLRWHRLTQKDKTIYRHRYYKAKRDQARERMVNDEVPMEMKLA